MKIKKLAGLIIAFSLGIFFANVGGDVSAQVKSLIGKKVTGEYSIVVNGKTLTDKGSIIDGRANVPIRALADSIGADIKVEGKTIIISTGGNGSTDKVVLIDGIQYVTKPELLNLKKLLEDNLTTFQKDLEVELAKTEQMESVPSGVVKDTWLAGINTLKEKIKITNEQLKEVSEALKGFQ